MIEEHHPEDWFRYRQMYEAATLAYVRFIEGVKQEVRRKIMRGEKEDDEGNA